MLAIVAGKKTQTRRLFKSKHKLMPVNEIASIHKDGSGKGWISWLPHPVTAEATAALYPGEEGFKSPYQVGDVLWIKENYYQFGQWKKNGNSKKGRQLWKFCPISIAFNSEDELSILPIRKNSYRKKGWYKRPQLFMPQKYARYWIKITDVRAERLQAISQEDARAEGVDPAPHRPVSTNCTKHADNSLKRDCFVCSYKVTWNQIHGPKGNQWDKNPWVWAYTFKLTKKP